MLAALANSAWRAANLPASAAYRRALRSPQEAQWRLLRSYLQGNERTAFGREHGFDRIQCPSDFQRRVPIRSYDEFAPYIARIAAGERDVLTAEPILRFAISSGSTAPAKWIPFTKRLHREFSLAVAPWIADLFSSSPSVSRGPAYWSITPVAAAARAVPSSSAVPVGFEDDSAYLGGILHRLVDAVLAVPSRVSRIPEIDGFRYVTLLYLLRQRSLRLISVWHPSFLALLLDGLPGHWESLLSDIHQGSCSVARDIGDAPWTRLAPMPARAAELRRIGPATPEAIWPKLSVVSCWTDSHARGPATSLAARFHRAMVQPKGLLATEGVVSIPYRGLHPLAIRSHFFEFLDNSGHSHLAHELRPGERYSVLLTTGGGLFRYRLHDLVEVGGMIAGTPTVRFVCKDDQVSDLVGEKLSEGFVLECLRGVFGALGIEPRFTMLAPAESATPVAYVLFVSSSSPVPNGVDQLLDQALRRNPQYGYARDLGQLSSPTVFQVYGDAYAQFVSRCLADGQRLGDVKPMSLSLRSGWMGFFKGHVVPSVRRTSVVSRPSSKVGDGT